MASTYVNDLRLNEMATGDASGTWGTTTNTNLELIAEAFSYGTEVITTNADTHTTTIADGATDPGRSLYLKYTGTLDSACTITIGPNTVSKVWIIENGTSGSQDIILSQGSGANITIPAGDTKVVYSDGAGAGAAFFDAFASLSVVDLIVGGDIDLEGSIDVNGTANLDIVDIDGAVNMATTALVTGVLTTTATQVATGGITSGSDIISDTDSTDSLGSTGVRWLKGWFDTLTAGTLTVGSGSVTDSSGAISFGDENLTTTGIVTAAGTSVFTNLDISGDIDVDGTTNLDVVDIDGAVDMASTLQVDSAATFSSTINTNNDVVIAKSSTGVPSLTLSGFAGASSPYSIINFYNSDGSQQGPNNAAQIKALAINSDGSGGSLDFHTSTGTGTEGADATKKVTIGGGGAFTTFPSAGQPTTFNEDGVDADFRVESDTSTHALFVDGGTSRVGINKAAPDRALDVHSGSASDITTFANDAGSYTFGKSANMGSLDLAADASFRIRHGATESVRFGPSETTFNEGSADVDFRVESDANTHMLFVDAGLNLVGFNAAATASDSGASFLVYVGGMKVDIGHNGSAANADEYIAFKRLGITLGSITQVSSTGVAYNTTSDQRLKENIADADDAGSKIDAIQVRQFDWKIDGSHQDYGMVAQELQAVAPEAVSAPEDLDEMMSVDYSKLVPMLIKEIQSLRARVADLES
jgi:hypothetical protein